MPQEKSSKGFLAELVDFFASVKLALVILISLAITSILGTLIPQGEPWASISGNMVRPLVN